MHNAKTVKDPCFLLGSKEAKQQVLVCICKEMPTVGQLAWSFPDRFHQSSILSVILCLTESRPTHSTGILQSVESSRNRGKKIMQEY